MLVTCDAESDELLLEELRRCGLVRLPGTWLDTGDAVQGSILLVESELEFGEFSEALDRFGCVFARHLAPVDYVLPLQGAEADLETIAELVPDLAVKLDRSKSFSVQARIVGLGKLPYRKVVLNETISQQLEAATGAAMDCRSPEQVVSILCTPETAYVGLSPVSQNRSAWPGGKHRFKRDEDQVSRAEFKLLEAIAVFGLELPSSGLALDIGASPGGWSRVLAAHGLQVDAVDPGDLDRRLKGNRMIRHFRKRIQEYSASSKEFGVIVNDMKMDARDSIEIMLGFAGRLARDGVAVITLKMPRMGGSASEARAVIEMLRDDLARLASRYTIVGARQLYHNRSEVTVAMRFKSPGDS
ncbi:MAG: SAM-dependent methyltransferase [Fimbriimonas sp.]